MCKWTCPSELRLRLRGAFCFQTTIRTCLLGAIAVSSTSDKESSNNSFLVLATMASDLCTEISLETSQGVLPTTLRTLGENKKKRLTTVYTWRRLTVNAQLLREEEKKHRAASLLARGIKTGIGKMKRGE